MQLLLDEILSVIDEKFDVKVYKYESIHRGLLNEKWVLHTNQGVLFVKCYNPERYRNHLTTIWQEIGQALRMQTKFHLAGGLCPRLFGNEEDGYLLHTPSDRKFVLMEHLPGNMVCAGKVNDSQMYALGLAVANMHHAWNGSGSEVPELIPMWKLNKTEMLEAWNQKWEEAIDASPTVRDALRLQKDILDQTNIDQLLHQTPGWTHLDMWVDNILFTSDGLSSIVDFDRVRYSFPIMDIGRAILSCTLCEGTFRFDTASAFADGYRTILPLSKGKIVEAVKYCWLIESFWWLRPGMDTFSVAPKRFAEEMLWTAERWSSLEDALGGL